MPPSQNQAWCPHATSSKMGDLTEAIQQGVSCAQQSVKNARGCLWPAPTPLRTASWNARTVRGSGAQVPFFMNPVCSRLLSILVNIWLCHIVSVGWLRECWPGAACWLCSENFADGLPGTWLMHAQVTLGRNVNFKSATASAHISFLTSGWEKRAEIPDVLSACSCTLAVLSPCW